MTNPDPDLTPGVPSADPAGAADGNPPPSPEAAASPAWPTVGAPPQPAAEPSPATASPLQAPGTVPPPASPTSQPAYGAPPYGTPPGWAAPTPDGGESRAPGLALGIILVAVGAAFLGLQLANITLGPDAWPLWLIVPGLAMVAGSLFIPSRGGLGLAVPGAILAIVGGILWVQATYNAYATWAYAWALVAPTGPGLAMLLVGAAHRDGDLVRDGLRTTLTGIGLFLGFGLFFEGVVGISGHRIEHFDQVFPYAAIGLGVLLIVAAFVDGDRGDRWREERRAERRAEKERRRAERAARRAAR